MRCLNSWLAIAGTAVLLSACGGGYSGGSSGSGSSSASTSSGSSSSSSSGGAITSFATPQEFFTAKVEPNMGFCRTCHVPGGVADTDKGKRFMLSGNTAEDYGKLQTSWTTLGKGVETNRILLKASNTDPEPHTGGSPWPKDSAQYKDMKILLSCWDNPAGCAALLAGADGGVVPQLPPLLGDLGATGGRNYAAQFCENKTDATPLPRDPRELIAGDNLDNKNYSVWYNDAFEICETDTLFKTQARQNALLVAKGEKPVYTAHPRPKTCGDWRRDVEKGRKYIMSNPITGTVLTAQSLYNLTTYLGYTIPSDPKEASDLLAKVAQQRYGWPSHPYPNPFPMPGEDPNQTNGGSLQLPVALVQTKDDSGKWTGKLGVTCFACHVGQIGTGEVVGNSAQRDGHPELYGGSKTGMFVSVNGSNTDSGLALYDIDRANSTAGMFGFTPVSVNPNDFRANLDTPGYMANRTRGTNAADQEIVNVLAGRDIDSLDFRSPLLGPDFFGKLIPSVPAAGGDQDMPTWWWTHNKTRYLWVGFGSAGSSRGNYFPSSTNPNDGHWSKHREGDYQDLDMWLNAVEAPKFVGPPVNTALAEQGAILFHSKDLWAGDGNKDIPRPPVGNGSCASCHGAYSPRYGSQPGFLPDPSLIGYSGATVPLSIVGTDPAQSNLFKPTDAYGAPTGQNPLGALNFGWFAYPDAQEGYRLPEEKLPLEEQLDDLRTLATAPGPCGLGTKGGYTAQPLHGVWASGPYFHNGSVPTVWDVLKPSDRPDVWRRQLVPLAEASPGLGDRGFDTNLTRAYDYDKLGWKYERLACDARSGASATSCQLSQSIPTVLDMFLLPYKIFTDYITPPYIAAPGEKESERAIYNTHAYSKSNQGHAFTKVLTDPERKALVEYLKTL